MVLFGSLARGDAVPGSDADLLLVLRESGVRFVERAAQYAVSDVAIGVDVLAYTRHELARMLREGNQFVRRALQEGVVLFEAETSENERGV